MKIPEGWKLVPVKLTDAMHVAGIHAAMQFGDAKGLDIRNAKREAVYRAQLAAAPTPPATIPLETLVAEMESDPETEAALNEARKKDMLEGATVTDITTAQDEPVLWYEAEESTRGKDIRHVIGSMLYSTRLSVTKPQTSNPVWPLYTHPAGDKLRRAAEELNQFIHDGMRFDDDAYKTEMLRLVENLRSALEGK